MRPQEQKFHSECGWSPLVISSMFSLLYFVRRAIEDGLEHLTEPVVLLMLGQIALILRKRQPERFDLR